MASRFLPETAFPLRVWGETLESQAEQQLRNVANLPILFHHVAVMPDVHFGLGATIGTVLASRDAVVPAAVGVDIGCGVSAVRLPFERGWFGADDRLGRLRKSIEREIPLGFNQYRLPRVSSEAKAWAADNLRAATVRAPLSGPLLEKAFLQLGTLGGGNHFIEICYDESDRGWVLLHSGSRNFGKQIADYHIGRAKKVHARKGSLSELPDPNLAYFTANDPEFHDYLADLFLAQRYARFNRAEMMRRILLEIAYLAHGAKEPAAAQALETERVDCHHNYVARETHFGTEVYVTRKGAVSAQAGEMGIVPGSMGSPSYIVVGKGNPESFCSCAHGAGRAMSRNEAKRRFSVSDLERQTEGVDCRKDKGVLDELPQAYKDIDAVMAQQSDLVEIRHRLRQLVCVKG